MIMIKLSPENYARAMQMQVLAWHTQSVHVRADYNPSSAVRQYASSLVG